VDDVVGLRLDDVGWIMSLFLGQALACQAGTDRDYYYSVRY